jgi:hypothetical protein
MPEPLLRDDLDRDRYRLDGSYGSGDPAPAPGRSTLTSRLGGGATTHVIFRVESPEAARELSAGLFGPRDGGGVAAGADDHVDRAAGSAGAALPADLRDRFERSLGADLSRVRIHTGDASATAAQAVGARAYTVDQDIHFGAGQYDPGSGDGLFLIAHEVAHTVQQAGAAPVRQHKLAVSSPADAAEVEADQAASAMVADRTFQVTGQALGVARKPSGSGTAKGGLHLSTKGVKFGGEAGGKVSFGIGKGMKFEGALTIVGEGEAEWWEKPPVAVGVGGAGTGDTKKGLGGEGTVQIDGPTIQDKAYKAAYARGEKGVMEGLRPVEYKPFAELPKRSLNEQGDDEFTIQAGCEFKLANGQTAKLQGGFAVDGSSKHAGRGLALSLSWDFPIPAEPMEIISDPKVMFKPKCVIRAKGSVKPDWKAIIAKKAEEAAKKAAEKVGQKATEKAGQKAAEKAGQKATERAGQKALEKSGETAARTAAGAGEGGALLAEEGIRTGAMAMGAAAAIELGAACALAGSIVAAFAIGASAISGNKEAIRAANGLISSCCEGAVAGVMGGGGGASNPEAFGKAKAAYAAQLDAKVEKLKAMPDQTLGEDEIRAALRAQADPDKIYKDLEARIRPAIAKRAADARYFEQSDDFYEFKSDAKRDARQVAVALGYPNWTPPDGAERMKAEQDRDSKIPSAPQDDYQHLVPKVASGAVIDANASPTDDEAKQAIESLHGRYRERIDRAKAEARAARRKHDGLTRDGTPIKPAAQALYGEAVNLFSRAEAVLQEVEGAKASNNLEHHRAKIGDVAALFDESAHKFLDGDQAQER